MARSVEERSAKRRSEPEIGGREEEIGRQGEEIGRSTSRHNRVNSTKIRSTANKGKNYSKHAQVKIGTCAGPAFTSIGGTSAASGATIGGMTPGRVTQGKQFTKAKITDLMVADLIKAELINRRSKEGRTDQIGGLQLGARADRPSPGSVQSGGARSPPT